jgi:hypothetical protein
MLKENQGKRSLVKTGSRKLSDMNNNALLISFLTLGFIITSVKITICIMGDLE